MYGQAVEEIRTGDYTKDNVQEAAKKLLAAGDGEIPVKIVDICQQMGFLIFQQRLPKEICGYIMIDGELKDRFSTDRIISVSAQDSNKRRRFTAAHELGHFLLDFKPQHSIYFAALEYSRSRTPDDSELRANRFAAELLMPAARFREEFSAVYETYSQSPERLYKTVQELSDRFLVPPKAVERRIKEELHLL